MSDDSVDHAEQEAKLALLQQIKSKSEHVTTPSGLKDLATAYALTVGAKYGALPGGDVKVSK